MNPSPPPLSWLNYHHLLYFWLVAREGGLKPAAAVLRVSHSTVSAQIHALERALGETLFARQGRRLVLTDMGRLVYRYAGEIFNLGQELIDATKDRASGRPLRLEVGVADAVPKQVVHRLLAPARALATPLRIVCREGGQDRLLADLSVHALDVVLTEAPVPAGSPVRAISHPLGESGVTFLATPRLVARLRGPLPGALDQAPLLLPTDNTSLRRGIDEWLHRHHVRPQVLGEFEDAALLQEFGADGMGVFPVPTVVEREVRRLYPVRVLGRTAAVKERFFALSMARRLEHPAVAAIARSARSALFKSN
jgi:LysR family transcriptional regulator, transcriptional activator of nhaA